jgi:hypothetical protein
MLELILQTVSQGGLSIIVFVIWYFTFKKVTEERKQTIDKYTELSEKLVAYLKEEQDYKALLAGILTRLEEKLNIPAQCPLLKNQK